MSRSTPRRLAVAVAGFALLVGGLSACRHAGNRDDAASVPGRARRMPWAPSAPVVRAPRPDDPDRDVPADEFTGSLECTVCHQDRWDSLAASFHAPLLEAEGSGEGCEDCHGAGLGHLVEGDEELIRHPRHLDPEANHALCLRCHAAVIEQPVRGHPEWIGERGLACTECHRVHVPRDPIARDRAAPPATTAADLAAAGAEPIPASRCITCHPGYHPDMERSPHAALATGTGCANCHGPGSLHAATAGDRDLILLPTAQPARAADAACTACHDDTAEPLLAWTCSEHHVEGVSCVDCHDPNRTGGTTLRKPDPALCADCHRDTAAEFRLPGGHRVFDGPMTCSDCHDPHGNEAGFHRFEQTRDGCARCHAEKAGPFVFDHTSKRLEGCTVCHRPHGSPNPRLLETREARTLCLSCHPSLPLSHEQKRGSPYRDCLQCHVEIHGSDVDRTFFR